MTDKNYDLVIVGAGVAGAVLAKVLSSAGKRVLLLEAGKQAGIELEAEAAYANYQSYLNTFYTAAAKVPNAPYPNLTNAPSPDVLNLGAFDRRKPVINQDDWPEKDDSKLRLTQGYFVQKGEPVWQRLCARARRNHAPLAGHDLAHAAQRFPDQDHVWSWRGLADQLLRLRLGKKSYDPVGSVWDP